jgi:RND family efflux transporter MFP subunit
MKTNITPTVTETENLIRTKKSIQMKKYHIIIAIFFAVMASSCGRQQGADDGHDHDVKLQLTGYCNQWEVFAEADPFAVGQNSNILAHFSLLENFKPLEEGRITVSLIVGEKGIRQTLEQSIQQGIYSFTLQPETKGVGRLVFTIETQKGKSEIVIPNITVFDNLDDAQHAAEDEAVVSSNAILFTKEQSWKVDFATEEVRKEPFGQVIRTIAQIQPAQGDERVISAKASGTALFNANITEGKAVNAGQTLFTIDGSGTADNNLAVRYAEAESEYSRAKIEYERKTELAKTNIVSQSDLLKAKTEFTNAEATYNNLRTNFSAGKQSVSSPISGFVTRVLVQNGQFVEAGQPIVVVSQNRDLFIKAEVQPRFFDVLTHITSANIRTLNNNRTYTLEELNGRVLSYGKTADISNPLIPVVFQVSVGAKNFSPLLTGSFVELFIKTQTSTQALTIPNEAIVEEMGNFFVFVQLTPEWFEKRVVKTGVTDGIRIEIKDGVQAGERIVSRGAILVKLAQTSGVLDAHAGHVH